MRLFVSKVRKNKTLSELIFSLITVREISAPRASRARFLLTGVPLSAMCFRIVISSVYVSRSFFSGGRSGSPTNFCYVRFHTWCYATQLFSFSIELFVRYSCDSLTDTRFNFDLFSRSIFYVDERSRCWNFLSSIKISSYSGITEPFVCKMKQNRVILSFCLLP